MEFSDGGRGMTGAAFGAVVAACIAAAVSLLGLIISKEQKTSDFRQVWIDALRAELSTYLIKVNSISDFAKHSTEPRERKIATLIDLYASLNGASFNIALRLNREEKNSIKLFESMAKFNKLFSSGELVEPDQIRPIETEFISYSQDLLRYEWKRVKSGEITFIVAKWICAVVLVLAVVLGGYALFQRAKAHDAVANGASEKGVRVNVVIAPAVERHEPARRENSPAVERSSRR
jgi:hypothetical protein